jgi:hypothetical protein
MFDYRLFFASSTMEAVERERRPLLGHTEKRVYRLPGDRRPERNRTRR